MAIPSGSGTEVLKRAQANGNSNTPVSILTVAANHIVTILSIIICNIDTGTSVTYNIQVSPAGSGACYLMTTTPIPGASTFIWNDKFVMTAADVLIINSSSGDFELYVSYIDQDWS